MESFGAAVLESTAKQITHRHDNESPGILRVVAVRVTFVIASLVDQAAGTGGSG